MTLPNAALKPARTGAVGNSLAGALAIFLAMAMASTAGAKPAPAGDLATTSDIATTIMANPHYAMAAKAYARRRGYQAERPVANRSNFLPVVSVVAVAATGVTLAAKGTPASH